MRTRRQPKRFTKPILRLLILWIIIFALAGCQNARTLRDAQNAFNEGARLENERLYESAFKQYGLNVNSQNDIGAPSVARPEPHYAAALEILRSIDTAGNADLRQNGLLGTKETLQALCLWKLGRGAEAISLAEAALGNLDAENEPRDWVIARALPALVINDEAYAKIPDAFTSKDEAKFRDVDNRLLTADNSAKSYIDGATGRAKDRPIEIWLLQVELAIYTNWLKARWNLLGERDIPIEEKRLLIDKCNRLEAMSKKYADEDQIQAAEILADGWRVTIFGTVNPSLPPD